MLLLFHEYQLDHPRFPGHARVAYIMAMVVPLCALLIADAIGWWNPWLWSASGVGLGLGLLLHSLLRMHRERERLSSFTRARMERSSAWFPYLFVLIQSSIASLIVLFIWFSATSMALPMPPYVHGIAIALGTLIPARRFVSAHIQPGSPIRYEKWRQILRGIWHALTTVLITRVIIGITVPNLDSVTQGNIIWQTMVWVPAAVYMMVATAVMLEQLRRIRIENPPPARTANPRLPASELVDKL
ncbi:MAG: hypothetical protein ACO398_09570 [Kiritimatiellia bacterium]|jgi:hypothetical protein